MQSDTQREQRPCVIISWMGFSLPWPTFWRFGCAWPQESLLPWRSKQTKCDVVWEWKRFQEEICAQVLSPKIRKVPERIESCERHPAPVYRKPNILPVREECLLHSYQLLSQREPGKLHRSSAHPNHRPLLPQDRQRLVLPSCLSRDPQRSETREYHDWWLWQSYDFWFRHVRHSTTRSWHHRAEKENCRCWYQLHPSLWNQSK